MLNRNLLSCRPCAEKLKAERKLKIGLSVKGKQTCEICGRRRFVYNCESTEESMVDNET